MPNVPPKKRAMLKTPDAFPISAGATALSTAVCAAGIASETPAPAMTSGATRWTKARSGTAISVTQAKPIA